MKSTLTAVITLCLVVSLVAEKRFQGTRGTDLDHTQWVAGVLKEIQTVKIGMTRQDLLKVFATEGGLSTRRTRTYAYKGCPYVKVDVEFRPIQQANEELKEFPDDKVVRISKPYLAWAVMD
jgi:hypothetical protein